MIWIKVSRFQQILPSFSVAHTAGTYLGSNVHPAALAYKAEAGASLRESLMRTLPDRQLLTDSVEKVGFSNGLNSGTTTTGEPTHHIEWFLGPSLTFAALLLG